MLAEPVPQPPGLGFPNYLFWLYLTYGKSRPEQVCFHSLYPQQAWYMCFSARSSVWMLAHGEACMIPPLTEYSVRFEQAHKVLVSCSRDRNRIIGSLAN
jgi:hypothetical protein